MLLYFYWGYELCVFWPEYGSDFLERSVVIFSKWNNKNIWRGFRPLIALFSENDFYEQHDFLFILHYQIVLVRELVQHLV